MVWISSFQNSPIYTSSDRTEDGGAVTNEEEILFDIVGDVSYEFEEKVFREVFYCVKTNSFEFEFANQP